MIVVVGNPLGNRAGTGITASGLSAAIARAAVARASGVEVVGKVADGPDGDAILLDLARSGVGHVAMLRDASGGATDDGGAGGDGSDEVTDEAGIGASGVVVDDEEDTGDNGLPSLGPPIEAADLALALRYLPDYRVVVIAQPLDGAAATAVADAARWAGATLVAVTWPGVDVTPLPDDTTLLEAPRRDAAAAFASMVGRYAAALDSGVPAADAFAAASADTGWAAVTE